MVGRASSTAATVRWPRRMAFLAFVAVAAVVLALVTFGQGTEGTTKDAPDGKPSAAPLTSDPTTDAATDAPSPSPSLGTDEATAGTPQLGPTETAPPAPPRPTTTVSLTETVDLGDGVRATVTGTQAVTGKARGAGEISGPAVRFTLAVENNGSTALAMELALMNVYYGPDQTPARRLTGQGSRPLTDPIAAGESGEGTYVFAIPQDLRDELRVEFSYSTRAPVVIFVGSAANAG